MGVTWDNHPLLSFAAAPAAPANEVVGPRRSCANLGIFRHCSADYELDISGLCGEEWASERFTKKVFWFPTNHGFSRRSSTNLNQDLTPEIINDMPCPLPVLHLYFWHLLDHLTTPQFPRLHRCVMEHINDTYGSVQKNGIPHKSCLICLSSKFGKFGVS